MADTDELPSEQEMSEGAEVDTDEEEERGSSAEEEGSDDEDEDDEGSDGEEGSEEDNSPSARRRPRKKHKPFVAPPPRSMPQRTTRGTRMSHAVSEEGDEEFWNQEFFAEEANDERYETESEPEDRFDADFNESEDDEDEEQEAEQAEADLKAKEPKRKTLKPPGYKKPPLPKPKPKAAPQGEGEEGPPSKGKQKQRRPSIGPEDFVVERRTVRESTRMKVEEGEMERKMAEKYKPRRAPQRSSNYRPLTQAELLAEAAKTEIENTKSLELLVLIEEETKKKAQVSKRRYAGPMVRTKSRRVGEAEMTTIEVRNMALPEELRHKVAPPPALRLPCAITGKPARYRDPATGLPYADVEAYRELQRRREAGLLSAPAPAAPSLASPAPGQIMAGVPIQSIGQQQQNSSQQQQQADLLDALQQPQLVQTQQPVYQHTLQQQAAPGLQQPVQFVADQWQQQPLLPYAPLHAAASGIT